MTSVELISPSRLLGGRVVSWWDPRSECTVTIAEPAAAPELFAEYHAGAVKSYARFGVADALDHEAARCAEDTALFWALTDVDGRVIGGVRAKGPLVSPDESHAVVEWAGQAGESAVRKMIAERIPFGVLEMKSAWLNGAGAHNPNRAKVIARSGFHAMALIGIDFCLATSAAYILEQWRSSGGVVAPVPATPYPDERYETKMMWWDRRTFAVHGEPGQVAAINLEMAKVRRQHGIAEDQTRRLRAQPVHGQRATLLQAKPRTRV